LPDLLAINTFDIKTLFWHLTLMLSQQHGFKRDLLPLIVKIYNILTLFRSMNDFFFKSETGNIYVSQKLTRACVVFVVFDMPTLNKTNILYFAFIIFMSYLPF
jgi:hypothetical protein